MAREVVTWCDLCLADNDEHKAGSEHVLVLPGMKAPKSIDLCEPHYDQWLAPVARLMSDYGKAVHADAAPKLQGSARSIARTTAKKYAVSARENIGPLFCQVPGCKGYSNRGGYPNIDRVRSHVRAIHPEVSWDEYLERFGEPQTGVRPPGQEQQLELDNDADERSDEEFACPHCSKVYSYETTARPSQALGVHLALKHGVPGAKRKAS